MFRVSISAPSLDHLIAAMRGAGRRIDNIILRGVTDEANILREAIAARTPVDVGTAQRGWQVLVTGTGAWARGSVVNRDNEVKILTLEGGRRPGARMPPPGALEGWAARHGFDTSASTLFLLARSIGRRGIKPHHMVRDGWNSTEGQRDLLWRGLAAEIEQALFG